MKTSGQLSVQDVILHILELYNVLECNQKNPMPLDVKNKLIDEFVGTFSDGATEVFLKRMFRA